MTSFLCVRKRETFYPTTQHLLTINVFSSFFLNIFCSFSIFLPSIALILNFCLSIFKLVHFISSFFLLYSFLRVFFFFSLVFINFSLLFSNFLLSKWESLSLGYDNGNILRLSKRAKQKKNTRNKCEWWTSVAIQIKYDKLIRSITAMHINKFPFYTLIILYLKWLPTFPFSQQIILFKLVWTSWRSHSMRNICKNEKKFFFFLFIPRLLLFIIFVRTQSNIVRLGNWIFWSSLSLSHSENSNKQKITYFHILV